jgi:NADH dehydrogenase
MILRPSVIFGNEDGFFNRFAAMSRMGPILPLVGGSTRFQPVYVEDVAAAAVLGVTGKAHGTYELGGPDALSLTAIIHRMLAVVQRRRLVANLPFWVGAVMATGLDTLSALTLGLFRNGVITTDQARQLRQDNVVQAGAKTLADLGINAANFDAIIPEYLWRYRATGQFAAIRDSAKHLRKG